MCLTEGELFSSDNLGFFQHTSGTHPEKTFYQETIEGNPFIVGLGGLPGVGHGQPFFMHMYINMSEGH